MSNNYLDSLKYKTDGEKLQALTGFFNTPALTKWADENIKQPTKVVKK